MATELLERNHINRPLSDAHVKRIAGQIVDGKWKYNGDTIKITPGGNILDGQHRLWAIIEANTAVDTLVANDVEEDAFSTMDTVRRLRTGGDVVALAGERRHRNHIAMALTWLIRWQQGIENYRDADHRVENSDIEQALKDNPNIRAAIERVVSIKGMVNPAVMGFAYYMVANRDPELAERMINTLRDPSKVPMSDPFYMLRIYFHSDANLKNRRDALYTIAVIVKAVNAAASGSLVKRLGWQAQGAKPEPFPKLDIKQAKALT